MIVQSYAHCSSEWRFTCIALRACCLLKRCGIYSIVFINCLYAQVFQKVNERVTCSCMLFIPSEYEAPGTEMIISVDDMYLSL